MSRPNPSRTIGTEDVLARRIAVERESRGWSYERLAAELTEVGCPIRATALFKIEKGSPRRRIVVDEQMAFTRVFGIPVEELLLPAEVARSKELRRLVEAWNAKRLAAATAAGEEDKALAKVRRHLEDHPEAGPVLEEIMATWLEGLYPADGNREWMLALSMHQATGAEEWMQRLIASAGSVPGVGVDGGPQQPNQEG